MVSDLLQRQIAHRVQRCAVVSAPEMQMRAGGFTGTADFNFCPSATG